MHSADESAAIVKTSRKTTQKFIQISMHALSDSEVESVIIKFNCQCPSAGVGLPQVSPECSDIN